MMGNKQKYKVGDEVEVYFLPESMSHFDKGRAKIIKVSHNTCQKGNDWEWSYGLKFYKYGTSYWYHHNNMRRTETSIAAQIKKLTKKITELEVIRSEL